MSNINEEKNQTQVHVTPKRLLVVVDYQNDFISGSLGFEKAQKIGVKIAQKLKRATESDIDIVFTADQHTKDYLQSREGKHLPIIHCQKDTWGAEISSEIQQYLSKAKKIFYKDTFGSAELGQFLAENDYTEIEICGLVAQICVLSNIVICQTYAKNAEIYVDLTAIASNLPQIENSFETYLKQLQVNII